MLGPLFGLPRHSSQLCALHANICKCSGKVCLQSFLQKPCMHVQAGDGFSGMEELIARIKSIVDISKAQLDMPEHGQVREHTVLSIA